MSIKDEFIERFMNMTLAEIRNTPEYKNTTVSFSGHPKSTMRKAELVSLLAENHARKNFRKAQRFKPRSLKRSESVPAKGPSKSYRSASQEKSGSTLFPPKQYKLKEAERKRIVKTLDEIAAFYILYDDNRKHAYRRAADEIAKRKILDIREIKSIKGVGKSISETIDDVLAMRQVKKIDDLMDNERFDEIREAVRVLNSYW